MKILNIGFSMYFLNILFISLLFLNSSLASNICSEHLEDNNYAFMSSNFTFEKPESYIFGDENLPIQVKKAQLIRFALKEQFPNLDIFVDPNSLPKKLDLFAFLDFFYNNSRAIQSIFKDYSRGDIIITDSTSIANYSYNGFNKLQLRFQVSNLFGSSVLHPFSKVRPLNRDHLVEQWRMFFLMTTKSSPKIIK